ncbi:MAG: hypothetical protein SPL75_02175 [Bacilli bacterium]|nr:hypothetical protein [Bacilli bacterium]
MKFDHVTGRCADLSFEGKGVVKLSYGTVFVDELFPGVEAEIEIEYKRAGSYFSKVFRLITKSKDKINQKWSFYSMCR